MRDLAQVEHAAAGPASMPGKLGNGQRAMLGGDLGFDPCHDAFGLFAPAMHQQPARAFRHMAAHQDDGGGQHRAQQEACAPAIDRPQHARVEDDQRQASAQRRADPEAGVDDEVHASAHARRNQLVNGRIDRRVLAADTQAGGEAA
ncbi:hypothetical protein HDC89_000136 [Herbaspirillum sp. SJZ102]|nr:hypothetical protein [Herbaspirillum sp. SJZ102]